MTTKFERIFHLARSLMRVEQIRAKEAILKAIELDEKNTIKHPTAEEIGMLREPYRRVKK